MSKWTHVNASIRYDVFLEDEITEKDLGIICSYEDWKDTDIPCGSEGSIGYSIDKTNQDGSAMYGATVSFSGDLRDYNDPIEILTYFIKITKDKMIRSGILEIDVEFEDTYIYRYNDEWKLVATIKYKED